MIEYAAASTIIRTLHCSLVKTLPPEDLVQHFFERNILSTDELDLVNSEPSNRKKVERVLISLHTTNQCEALIEWLNGQERYKDTLSTLQHDVTEEESNGKTNENDVNYQLLLKNLTFHRERIISCINPDKLFGILFQQGSLDAQDYEYYHVFPCHGSECSFAQQRTKAGKLFGKMLLLSQNDINCIGVFAKCLLKIFKKNSPDEHELVNNCYTIMNLEHEESETFNDVLLNTNLSAIVEDLDINEGNLMNSLFASGHLSSDDCQEIIGQASRKRKSALFLRKIGKSSSAVDQMFEILQGECPHLASLIKPYHMSRPGIRNKKRNISATNHRHELPGEPPSKRKQLTNSREKRVRHDQCDSTVQTSERSGILVTPGEVIVNGYLLKSNRKLRRTIETIEGMAEDGDFNKFDIYCDRVLETKIVKSNPDFLVQILLEMVVGAYMRSDEEKGEALLSKAEALLPKTKLPSAHTSHLMFMKSAISRKWKNFNEAQEAITAAMQAAEAVSPGRNKGQIYYNQATLLAQLFCMNHDIPLKTFETIGCLFKRSLDEYEADVYGRCVNQKRRTMIRFAMYLLDCWNPADSAARSHRPSLQPNADKYIREAKLHLDTVEDQYWDGMPSRLKCYFFLARSDYHYRLGTSKQRSQEYALDALNIASNCNLTSEIQYAKGRVSRLGEAPARLRNSEVLIEELETSDIDESE